MFTKIAARLVMLGVLGGILWMFWSVRPIRHAPGVLVPKPPVQKDIAPKPLPSVKGWELTAVAEYELKACVLDTKRYHSGRTADLAPIDVAVGWGRMSDQAVIDQFTISMTNRFFFYEWSKAPTIPLAEIESSAANNHVIAANDGVRRVIRSLRPGHIVTMKGFLVNAHRPGGGNWNTSLRRDDTGNGACEIFYVESAKAVSSLSEELK